MNKKLDNAFAFRDKPGYVKFNKIYTILVFSYALAILIAVCILPKDNTRGLVFALLPLILLLSFGKKNDYLILLAEFLTIIADIFMILLKKIDYGFPIYLLVQITYALYFFFQDDNKKREIITLIIRGVLMVAVIVVLAIMKKLNLRFGIGGIYFVNILVNIVCAIFTKNPFLIAGFITFAISDTFIGLGMLFKSTSDFGKFLASFNFVYFFYIISQMLLILYKDKFPFVKKVKEEVINKNDEETK